MRNDESRIQRACVRWWRLQYPHHAALLFSVPNGGARNVVTASIIKAEGAVRGVADLILFVPRGGFHALCIEMKTPKGRQSPHQKEWQRIVEAQGYRYIVVRSVAEFIEQVTRYFGLPP